MLWLYSWFLLLSTTICSPAWIEHYLTTGVHRKLTGDNSAVYFTFTHSKSLREVQNNLLWVMDPCGRHHELTEFGNRTVACGDSYVMDFVGNATLVEQMCNQGRFKGSTPSTKELTERSRHPDFDVLWVGEEKCKCSSKCVDGTIIDNWPTCTCRRTTQSKYTQPACDFIKRCDWTYEKLGFKAYNTKNNFMALVAAVVENGTVAKMFSPYYTQFTSSCTLSFLYNVAGHSEAHLGIYLEWRQYPGQHSNAKEVLLSKLKLHQENRNVLDYHEVRIGFVTKQSRIRIECRTGDGEGKAICKFANLTWNNCAERDITNSPCLEHKNPTLCQSQGRTVCMEDVACDGIRDCPNGEDEDNCDYVEKVGSKCNFENTTGMCGWEEKAFPLRRDGRKLFIRGRMNLNLSVEESEGKILETKVMRELPRSDSGYFLMISNRKNGQSVDSREYYLESPLLPPTRQLTGDTYRPEEICTARFRYCIKGSEQRFVFELEKNAHLSKNIRTNVIPLWEAVKTTIADFEAGTKCEWELASVSIPRQLLPFRLRFNLKVMSRYPLPFIAIDDFSINPSCFDYNSHVDVPINQSFATCGKTGTEIPQYDECRRESLSNGGTEVTVYDNGTRMLTVTKDGYYWVKLCGGAGGSFPGAPGVGGNCITGTVHLYTGNQMVFFLGQKGESPCSGPTAPLSSQQEKIFNYVCGENSTNSTITDVVDTELYIGAGGGGLSALFYPDGTPGMVAGGGGGAFPKVFQVKRASFSINGNGFSLKSNHTTDDCNAECVEATPRSIYQQGTCYKKVPFESQGGYGGGGASCGIGGGGGGGYFGGRYGRFSQGTSGSDFVSEPISNGLVGYFHGVNPGDGSLNLIRCSLDCKPPGYCDFLSSDSPQMVCSCGEGKIIVNDTCVHRIPSEVSPLTIPRVKFGEFLIGHWIIVTILVLLFIVVVGVFVRRYNYSCFKVISKRHLKETKTEKHNEGTELLEINQTDMLEKYFANQPFIKNIPSKNLLMLLNRIDDNDLKLLEPIGQGAFGNVCRGIYKESEEYHREVAVKVLNNEWSNETESATRNFITEALLMSLSNNVGRATIQLIGVVFDKRPFKIVMELMKGGNLLTFLRASRPVDGCDNPYNLTMRDLIQFAKDIVEGCLILEKNQHLHRDLAARNCLLTKLGTGRRVKIGDFGLATELYSSGEYVSRVRHRPIPMKWMPPEAIQDGIFSTKTDVWSFGVVCWEIFTIGQIPYPTVPSDYLVDILAQGKRLAKPKGCPSEIYEEMMLECWQPHPEDRPSFAMLEAKLSKLMEDERLAALPIPLVYGSEKVSSPVLEDPIFNPIVGTPATIETNLPTPSNTDAMDDNWTVSEKAEGLSWDAEEPSSCRKTSNVSEHIYYSPLNTAFKINNIAYKGNLRPQRPTQLPLAGSRVRGADV